MKEPQFKPEYWVTYKQGEIGGFGRIIGGTFDGAAWHYTIQGSLADGSDNSVLESDITYLFQNGTWISTAGGPNNSSAYKDA